MSDGALGQTPGAGAARTRQAVAGPLRVLGKSFGAVLLGASTRLRRLAGSLLAHSGQDLPDPEAALRDALAAAALVRAALTENETRLRLALAVADVGVWEFDVPADRVRIDDRNAALVPLALPANIWIPRDGAEIRALLERIHPADRRPRRAALQAMLDGVTPSLDIEYRIRDDRGNWRRIVERAAVLVRDRVTGTPRRIVGISRDVTGERDAAAALERMVAERTAALAESERRCRSIVEASPELVLLLTPEGRVLEANQRWLSFFRRELAEVQGQLFWFLASADNPERVARKQRDIARAAAGETVRYEVEMLGPAGRRAMADVSIEPIRGAAGTVEMLVIAARDITERVRLQTQLAQAQKMEAVGQLTSGVAHDFNNLLQAVCGNLDLIRRFAEGAGETRLLRLAANAQRAVARGARLTQQMLAFSRRQNLQPERVWIGRLFEETGDLIARAGGEKVQVRTIADADIWPCQIDPVQFQSALLNLITNARDAMPEGGVLTIAAANVLLAAAPAAALELPPGDYVRIEVTDTGTGIAPEHLPRLFEPFFTTKEVGKGTGLGLAMVHGFARQSGGTVSIASKPGHGTTVSLFLPREVVVEPPAPERRPTAAPPGPPGSGLAILVVEDDPEVLDAIEFALLDAGHRVLTAGDAEEALAVLSGPERVDVLLCDVVLRGAAGGIEVAAAASRLRPGLRVLLATGYGEEIARPGIAYDVLAKPFSQAELLRRIAASSAATGNVAALV
jgi:PAS domain S-box-containing protein